MYHACLLLAKPKPARIFQLFPASFGEREREDLGPGPRGEESRNISRFLPEQGAGNSSRRLQNLALRPTPPSPCLATVISARKS